MKRIDRSRNVKGNVRWAVSGLFIILAMGSLIDGGLLSTLMFALGAIVLLPIKPLETIKKQINMKKTTAVILSVVLFLGGALFMPVEDGVESDSEDTGVQTSIDEEDEKEESEKADAEHGDEELESDTLDNSTLVEKPSVEYEEEQSSFEDNVYWEGSDVSNNTPSGPDQSEAPPVVEPVTPSDSDIMVWVPTNGGERYHCKESCSKMENPRYVTLAQAKVEGFTRCGRCKPAY